MIRTSEKLHGNTESGTGYNGPNRLIQASREGKLYTDFKRNQDANTEDYQKCVENSKLHNINLNESSLQSKTLNPAQRVIYFYREMKTFLSRLASETLDVK